MYGTLHKSHFSCPWMPGVILSICSHSVCMDSAQTLPQCPLLLSRMSGVILGICPHSVCMDSAHSPHFSCPGCRVSFSVSVPILYVWTLHSPTSPV
ncbi:unnamed protein product, partial [Staurois parvus]